MKIGPDSGDPIGSIVPVIGGGPPDDPSFAGLVT